MIKLICDKCKREMPSIDPLSNAIIPQYIIYKNNSYFYPEQINLCDSCQELFKKWLQNEDISLIAERKE